jgi:hypothetical protein
MDGPKSIPFSLCGFATDADAALFLDMANRYIPDDMKSDAFKEAYKNRDSVVRQARRQVSTLLGETAPAESACDDAKQKQEAKQLIAALTEAQKPADESVVYDQCEDADESVKIDLSCEDKIMETAIKRQ